MARTLRSAAGDGRFAPLAALLLAAGLATACAGGSESSAGQEATRQIKRVVPGARFSARVESVRSRAGYLEATITSGDRGTQVFVFAPTEECAALLQPEASLTHTNLGTFGQFTNAEGGRCDPLGTLTLVEWRRDRPTARSGARGPSRPRARAHYRLIHRDEEYAFLHGRFPLAGLVGVVGGQDLVAVVRNVPECRLAIERTTSSMEHLERSPYLVLLSDGQCPINGLAIPLPPSQRN